MKTKKLLAILLCAALLIGIVPLAGLILPTVAETTTEDLIAYVDTASTAETPALGSADTAYTSLTAAIEALDDVADTDTVTYNRIVKIVDTTYKLSSVAADLNDNSGKNACIPAHDSHITIVGNDGTNNTLDLTAVFGLGGPVTIDDISYTVASNGVSNGLYVSGHELTFGSGAVSVKPDSLEIRIFVGIHTGVASSRGSASKLTLLGDGHTKIARLYGYGNGDTGDRKAPTMVFEDVTSTYLYLGGPSGNANYTTNYNVEINGTSTFGTINYTGQMARATFAENKALQIILNNGVTNASLPRTFTDANSATQTVYFLNVATDTAGGATLSAVDGANAGVYQVNGDSAVQPVVKDTSGNAVDGVVYDSDTKTLTIPTAGEYNVTWEEVKNISSTVYVDYTNGDDATIYGSEEAPFKTLTAAIKALNTLDTDEERTIVLMSDYSISSNDTGKLPSHDKSITIKGYLGTEILDLSSSVSGGPLTIDSICYTFEKDKHFHANGNALTFGENAAYNTGTSENSNSGRVNVTSALTIDGASNKLNRVYLFANSKSETVPGVDFVMNGGTLVFTNSIYIGATKDYETTYSDDVNVEINGGTLTGAILINNDGRAQFTDGAAVQIIFNNGTYTADKVSFSDADATLNNLYILECAEGGLLHATTTAGTYETDAEDGVVAVAYDGQGEEIARSDEAGLLTVPAGEYTVEWERRFAYKIDFSGIDPDSTTGAVSLYNSENVLGSTTTVGNYQLTISFEYYLTGNSRLCVYNVGVSGSEMAYLQPGRHTYTESATLTALSNGTYRYIPAIKLYTLYSDLSLNVDTQLYLWDLSVTITNTDTGESNAYTELSYMPDTWTEGGFTDAGGTVERISVDFLPENMQDTLMHKLDLDATGAADGLSAIYKTYAGTGAENTVSFSYWLPHGVTVTAEIRATGGIKWSQQLEYGQHTIEETVTTADGGRDLQLRFTVAGNNETTLYLWDVSVVSGSSRNYFTGTLWRYSGDGHAATDTMLGYDAALFSPNGGTKGAQRREDNAIRFISVLECAGVTRTQDDPTADYTNGTITIDGVSYGIVTAGTLFARAVKRPADQSTDEFLRFNTENVFDIPAKKILGEERTTAYLGRDVEGIAFTGVITNIPQKNQNEYLLARCYVIYRDGDVEKTVYGNIVSRSIAQMTRDSIGNVAELSGGYDENAAVMRENILTTDSSVTSADATGTVYYVSADNGDDTYTGTSQDAPFKTLGGLKSVALTSGDVVLFERGGIYRGRLALTSGVKYGAYGSGEKPRIYGSPENYGGDESRWEVAGVNLWRMPVINDWSDLDPSGRSLRDIGNIVFGSSEQEDQAYAVRRTCQEDVCSNFDFWFDTENGYVYLYLDAGNPGKLYENIEVCYYGSILSGATGTTDVTIDNLNIRYGGSHGIAFQTDASNITITNCEIAWVGGADSAVGGTDYGFIGNGIEFLHNCTNITVDGCYVHQCYDAGLTHQSNDYRSTVTMDGITLRNNLIEYCCYSIEVYVYAKDTYTDSDGNTVDAYRGQILNTTYTGNVMRFSGYGFGNVNREERGSNDTRNAHITLMKTAMICENYTITGNVFDISDRYMVISAYADGEQGPTFSGNRWFQSMAYASDFNSDNGKAAVALMMDTEIAGSDSWRESVMAQYTHWAGTQTEMEESVYLIDTAAVNVQLLE